jgi:hypothetical protein
MPLLPTGGYSAQVGQLPINGGRRASAEDDPTAAALGGLSHTIQHTGNAVLDQMAQDESRKAQVGLSEVRAKYAKELDDAALSGADTAKIKERMMADIDNIGQGYGTKAGVSTVRIGQANAALMFDQQANAINVQRAFAEAKSGANKIVSNEASILAGQPTYLPTAIANVNAYIDTFPNVSPEKKQELKDFHAKQMNMSAVLATIRTGDPASVAKDLTAGKYDLSPEQRELAQHAAKTEETGRRTNETYLREEARREFHEGSEKQGDDYYKQIRDPNSNKAGLMRSILDDSKLERPLRQHLITTMDLYAKELAHGEKTSDPQVMRGLWLSAYAQPGDAKKRYDAADVNTAVERGQLNTRDAETARGWFANQRDENNVRIGAKLSGEMSVISHAFQNDPKFAGQPALVATIQLDYQARVLDKVAEYRKAQKDPNELFNPQSKDWVGSAEFIAGSVTSARERQRAAMPAVVDLRAAPNAEIQVNQPFINSKGQQVVMTPEAFAARSKAPKAAEPTEQKRLSDSALHYRAAQLGVAADALNPYTGEPWAAPAEAPPPPGFKPLPFNPLSGGVQPKGR